MPIDIRPSANPTATLAQIAAQAGAAAGERDAKALAFQQNMQMSNLLLQGVGMGLQNRNAKRGLDLQEKAQEQAQQRFDTTEARMRDQFDREQKQQDFQFEQMHSPEGWAQQVKLQDFDLSQESKGLANSAQIREHTELSQQIFQLDQIAKDPQSPYNQKWNLTPDQAAQAKAQLQARKDALPPLANGAKERINANVSTEEIAPGITAEYTVDRSGRKVPVEMDDMDRRAKYLNLMKQGVITKEEYATITGDNSAQKAAESQLKIEAKAQEAQMKIKQDAIDAQQTRLLAEHKSLLDRIKDIQKANQSVMKSDKADPSAAANIARQAAPLNSRIREIEAELGRLSVDSANMTNQIAAPAAQPQQAPPPAIAPQEFNQMLGSLPPQKRAQVENDLNSLLMKFKQAPDGPEKQNASDAIQFYLTNTMNGM